MGFWGFGVLGFWGVSLTKMPSETLPEAVLPEQTAEVSPLSVAGQSFAVKVQFEIRGLE